MARYLGPSCKLCRREGVKLFLKGAKCSTNKCGYEAMYSSHHNSDKHDNKYGKRKYLT